MRQAIPTRDVRLPRRWLACVALLASVALACSHASPTEPDAPVPSWLESLIEQIQSQPVTNPPSAILSYRYHGETVYFRPARCCDVPSDLYDRDGELLCHPDGGSGGGGDARCPDFLAQRTGERLIWRDARR